MKRPAFGRDVLVFNCFFYCRARKTKGNIGNKVFNTSKRENNQPNALSLDTFFLISIGFPLKNSSKASIVISQVKQPA